jgi:predicted ATPase
VIIIEGCDGAGKSRLVKRLHEDLGIELSPESRLGKTARNDPAYRAPGAVRLRTYKALSREVVGRKAPAVYDRLFFSECIYSAVYDRTCAFSNGEQLHITRVMNACKALVVFCSPPWEEIAKQWLQVDQETNDGVTAKNRLVYQKYIDWGQVFMRRGKNNREFRLGLPHDYAFPPVVWYDYTNPKDYGRIKTEALKYLSYRAKRSAAWVG